VHLIEKYFPAINSVVLDFLLKLGENKKEALLVVDVSATSTVRLNARTF